MAQQHVGYPVSVLADGTDTGATPLMSRSVIYEQTRVGRLKSVTQGRTRLIPATAIADYISMLQREANGDDTP